MAYSPDTWYCRHGHLTDSRTARSTSRHGIPGLTMSASAPSATSSRASAIASRTFAASIW
jgi:hypothetical protein